MSNMKIKIIAVEQGTAKSAKGNDYKFVEVTYKNMTFEGKVESKKHNQYGNKEVFNALADATAGESYTIVREKDDKGYWQWIGIAKGDVEIEEAQGGKQPMKAQTTNNATPAPKSTYETAEERAKKQVYIVRQSSISAAIDLLKTDKKIPTVGEVIEVAKQFEAYVFGLEEAKAVNAVEKLPEFDDDDIPM